MDPEKQRAIASKGGKAAHAKGTAHRFTPAEASEAGRKGGRAAHARGTAHRFTAEEASEAGRKGGSSRSASARQHRATEGNRGEGESAGRFNDDNRHGMAESARHAPDLPATETFPPNNEQSVSRQPGAF
jgi:general stress protein YciG